MDKTEKMLGSYGPKADSYSTTVSPLRSSWEAERAITVSRSSAIFSLA